MEEAKSEIVAPEPQVRSFEDLLLLVSNGSMCFECLEEEDQSLTENQRTGEKIQRITDVPIQEHVSTIL